MQVDNKFFEFLEKREGFKPCPYLDGGGVPTIGIGTTFYPDGKPVSVKDKCITREEAYELVKNYTGSTQRLINDLIYPTCLTQNQFNALVSFVYNVGDGAFMRSGLLKKVKANPNSPDIEKEFMKWVYDNGKQVDGLKNRRLKEVILYNTK